MSKVGIIVKLVRFISLNASICAKGSTQDEELVTVLKKDVCVCRGYFDSVFHLSVLTNYL